MSRHEDNAWDSPADGPTLREAEADADDGPDPRDTAKCGKCFDTGTVYESHGEAVNCEAPGCDAVPQFEEVDALPRDTIETPPPVCKRCEDIAKNNAVGPWNPHTCGGEDPEQS